MLLAQHICQYGDFSMQISCVRACVHARAHVRTNSHMQLNITRNKLYLH